MRGEYGQAAELEPLDEDAVEDDEDVDAAGFASDDEELVLDVDEVEDFDDEAGELLDDEPRLSFR